MFLWDLDDFLLGGFLEGVHFEKKKLFVMVHEGQLNTMGVVSFEIDKCHFGWNVELNSETDVGFYDIHIPMPVTPLAHDMRYVTLSWISLWFQYFIKEVLIL